MASAILNLTGHTKLFVMPKIIVRMDSGGEIRDNNSDDELYTEHFGGCTAIYAKTDTGLFALYHLNSTIDREPVMVKSAADSNEPYRDWIKKLKASAKGERLHFFIGTPKIRYTYGLFTDDNHQRVVDVHPSIGMERYLRKLCHDNNITDYDITLLSMTGVHAVSVTKNGMNCFGISNEIVNYSLSQYQSDEEIIQHSKFTNKQILENLMTDPNIDYDGALRNKYELLVLMENLEMKINEFAEIYSNEFYQADKGNVQVSNNYIFISELKDVFAAKDTNALRKMKQQPYFKSVTMSHDSKHLSKLGLLFEEVERCLSKQEQQQSQMLRTRDYHLNK